MTGFEVADLVAVAVRALRVEPAAALDLVDLAAAERALAEARRWCERDPVEQGAAALLTGLLRHRPVASGNELVALLATLQFLAVHGFDLDLDPPEAARDLVRGVAAGALDPPALAAWVAARLRRRDGANPKEEGMLRRLTRRGRGRPGALFLDARQLGDPFGRYTDRARRTLDHAQGEASGLGHDRIGTEHLLLGLLVEEAGVAARALGTLGVGLEEVRARIEQLVGRGQRPGPAQAHEGVPAGPLPFTPRSKKVLELSVREALRLHHSFVGTEHLLLALVREGEGLAAKILAELGADPARVHQEVARLLREHGIEPDGGTTRSA